MEKWDKLIALRNDVNGVLESARADKRIGKPLEAAVTLRAEDESSRELLDAVSDMDLSDLLIVSRCLVEGEEPADAVRGQGARNPGLRISVTEAPGTKCPRCWKHSLEADPATELCPRCARVVAKL
jgi:isoleucyl-tRNA synthetase